MPDDSTKQRVLNVIGNVTDDSIAPEHKLIDDLGLDSLDRLEIGMDLENEFDIEIDDEDVAKWQTVGDVISYIEKHHEE